MTELGLQGVRAQQYRAGTQTATPPHLGTEVMRSHACYVGFPSHDTSRIHVCPTIVCSLALATRTPSFFLTCVRMFAAGGHHAQDATVAMYCIVALAAVWIFTMYVCGMQQRPGVSCNSIVHYSWASHTAVRFILHGVPMHVKDVFFSVQLY